MFIEDFLILCFLANHLSSLKNCLVYYSQYLHSVYMFEFFLIVFMVITRLVYM